MEKNRKSCFSKREKIDAFILAIVTVIMLLVTLFGLIYFQWRISDSKLPNEQYNEYERQYVLITKDIGDTFWDTVYDQMVETGEKSGVYVERLGKNLSVEFSKADLMEIAIDSNVDGIILEADESDKTTALINKANAKGIPVVTILHDCMGTPRVSYVGISNYNLGSEYGKLISSVAADTKGICQVLLLMDSNSSDPSQNIIYSAIQDELENEQLDKDKVDMKIAKISNDSPFSAEESIRDVFEQYHPDVVVCLNELNTTSVYQMVVDQNKVGQTAIIGYYDSDTILRAVERNVIFATITVNTEQMGRYCVEALNEYVNTGHVSDYYSVDFTLINADNVKKYLRSEDKDEE